MKPSEHWACYLVRLESNLRRIGLNRGAPRLKRKRSDERKDAIDDATSVKLEELTPIERRAVELLKRGAGKQRVRPRKNFIEERAIRLAESVKRKWFPPKRKPKVWAKHDLQPPITLSITDVISIAAPIIEEFAKEPILFRKRGSDSYPPSFEALYSAVCASSKSPLQKSTVMRLLRRIRSAIPLSETAQLTETINDTDL
jgi:hypothetical protein